MWPKDKHNASGEAGTSMRGSRGGAGGKDPHPRKNHRNIGFRSKTGPYPMKNYKATKPVFNVGPSLAIRWWADDGSLLVVFGPFSLII